MDPLSITASIVAVLQLTTNLITYLNDVKQMTSEQKQVAVEASNLYSLLATLRFRLDEAQTDDAWFDQVKRLGAPDGPLDQFKSILEEILGHTAITGNRRRLTVALTWKWTKTEVDQALQRIERLKMLVNLALTTDTFRLAQAIENEVSHLVKRTAAIQLDVDEVRTNADRELQERLSHWLQVPDPSSNYHAALSKRHAQTGSWLIKNPQLQKWKSSASSLLWLHGKAGCGKTVLSATALEHVLDHVSNNAGAAVAYFYFDFNSGTKQQTNQALRSILFQLALKFRDCYHALKQIYQQHNNGQMQPSEDRIHAMLMSAVALPNQKYIVLDALDECTDRSALLAVLRTLVASPQHEVHILATSRRERDIEEQLLDIADHVVDVESTVVDSDISVYVHDQLTTDLKLKKWPMTVRDEIMSELTTKANGMFQWVFCQLESLRTCVKLSALRKVLTSLPKTLDETYARIIRNLESDGHLFDAITVLQWLCFANRPLRLCEVVEILAIQCGEDGGFDPNERLPDPEDVKTICSSLISCHRIRPEGSQEEVEEEETVGTNREHEPLPITDDRYHQIEIRLAHFSVKTYLLSDRSLLKRDLVTQRCHDTIAEGCLRYLIYIGRNKGYKTTYSTAQSETLYPLAQYAGCFWWRHMQHTDIETNTTLINLSRELFDSQANMLAWMTNSDLHSSTINGHVLPTIRTLAPPLYYACLVDLFSIVDHLLKQGADPNAYSDDYLMLYGTALQAASHRGGHQSVQLLLERGVDFDLKTGTVGSPLALAARQGHINTIQLLLDNGMDVDDWDGIAGQDGTALEVASETGNVEIVQLLLDRGANIDDTRGVWGCAVSAAGVKGHIQIVQLLLNRGADPNVERGCRGYSPIQAVSECGHTQIVQLLLDRGAKVNIDGEHYPTALQIAAKWIYTPLVQLLIERGADINANNDDYDTALMEATEVDEIELIKLLLEHGADVDAHSGQKGTVLMEASLLGFTDTVKLLLKSGADVNARGGQYGSALQAASSCGQEDIVRLLLDSDADIDAQGKIYGTALYAALHWAGIHNRNWSLAHLLLARGADANIQGGLYGTALRAAVTTQRTHLPTIQALIDAGADVNARTGDWNETAIAAAAEWGDVQIVQLLLDAGADVNPPGGLDRCETPLRTASYKGHRDVVRLLLDNKAEVDARAGWDELTPLETASERGHLQIVQLLLDQGAELDPPRGFQNWSMLGAATVGGCAEIVQLLLDRGADINSRGGRYNYTPLHTAICERRPEIARLLLDRGADIHLREGRFNHNTVQVASREGDAQLVQLLLDHGGDIHDSGGKGDPGATALHMAATHGHVQVVQLLLDRGANINARGGDENKTAFQLALEENRETAALALLDRGADFNTRGVEEHMTALQCASNMGHEQVVQALLKRGADVNARRNRNDITALQLAAQGDHEEIVKLLIHNGADINARGGEENHTALQRASFHGCKETIQILIDSGADINARAGEEDYNALQMASSGARNEIVRILLSNGADVHARAGKEGMTALHLASGRDDRIKCQQTVLLLIKNGADINARGGKGNKTPLQIASEHGHEQILQLLMQHGAKTDV